MKISSATTADMGSSDSSDAAAPAVATDEALHQISQKATSIVSEMNGGSFVDFKDDIISASVFGAAEEFMVAPAAEDMVACNVDVCDGPSILVEPTVATIPSVLDSASAALPEDQHSLQPQQSPSNVPPRMALPQFLSKDVDHIYRLNTAAELIEKWEYPVEVRQISTKDKAILTLHRIPNPRYGKSTYLAPHAVRRHPVLLWHGLGLSANAWVCAPEGPSTNLAFILADEGFDVWLVSGRGSWYDNQSRDAKRNATKKGKSGAKSNSSSNTKGSEPTVSGTPVDQRWDFSIDEMANLDVPLVVNFILQITRKQKLSYIGYSQGTTSVFGALAVDEALNNKIDVVVALAASLKPPAPTSTVLRSLLSAFGGPEGLYTILGRGAFLDIGTKARNVLPGFVLAHIIDHVFHILFDWNPKRLGCKERKKALYGHVFSGASMKNIVHWFQVMQGNSSLQHYIPSYTWFNLFGSTSSSGPSTIKYPTKHISTKLHLFVGDADNLSDIDHLKRHMPSHASFHVIPEYSHLDFLWSIDVRPMVLNNVVDIIKEASIESLRSVLVDSNETVASPDRKSRKQKVTFAPQTIFIESQESEAAPPFEGDTDDDQTDIFSEDTFGLDDVGASFCDGLVIGSAVVDPKELAEKSFDDFGLPCAAGFEFDSGIHVTDDSPQVHPHNELFNDDILSEKSMMGFDGNIVEDGLEDGLDGSDLDLPTEFQSFSSKSFLRNIMASEGIYDESDGGEGAVGSDELSEMDLEHNDEEEEEEEDGLRYEDVRDSEDEFFNRNSLLRLAEEKYPELRAKLEEDLLQALSLESDPSDISGWDRTNLDTFRTNTCKRPEDMLGGVDDDEERADYDFKP